MPRVASFLFVAWAGPAVALLSLGSIFESFQYTQSVSIANNATQTLSSPFPYDFPDQNAANTSGLFPMPQCHGITIEEATIDQLQQYLSSGNITSQQLVVCYMQRMWQVDQYINSVLEINPDLLQIAAQLDSERLAGHVRGPVSRVNSYAVTNPHHDADCT